MRLTIDTDDNGSYFEMFPVADAYGFDSSDDGAEGINSWESHSITRYWTVADGCTCRVRAERAVSSASTIFDTDDWLLTTETHLRQSDEDFS